MSTRTPQAGHSLRHYQAGIFLMSGAAMLDFCNRLQKPKKYGQIAEMDFLPLYLMVWWGSENPHRQKQFTVP